VLPALAKTYKFDLNTPWRDLAPAVQKILLKGAPGKSIGAVECREQFHEFRESAGLGDATASQ